MSENNELETQFLNAAATHLHQVDNSVPFVAVPRGHALESIEQFLEQPTRIRKALKVLTPDSFIKYFNKFCDDDSLVVLNDDNQSITGFLDYHAANAPSWCDHQVQYACPKSREWETWNRFNKNKFDQLGFAEFIEENIKDFAEPSGGELLEIATKFSVIRTAVFNSGVKLQSGEFEFQFSEQNNSKGTVTVPEKIAIGIAPFHNGTKYRIEARLRYRLREGELKIWYELIEPEKVLEDAFNEVKTVIRNGIDKVLMLDAAA
ncbi:MAG: YfdQ family protein [Thalassotalea sp.]|nr:YfdQ family protein [Thalassotalea sp.]